MKDREIDAAIARAKARRSKLRELLRINRQNEALEHRYLVTNSELAKEFRRFSEIVTAHFKVPVASVLMESREEKYIVPRHSVIYLLRRLTGAPLEAIGKVARKNHGSVRYAVLRIEDRMATNRQFAADIDALRRACEKERHEVLGN